MRGNELGGIEHGLGKPPLGPPFARVVAAPSIEEARYDGTETVVSGRSCAPEPTQVCEVLLFASDALEADGSVEGDQFLGRVPAGSGGRFTFRTSADLTGRFITGVTRMRYGYIGEFETPQTSEFSDALIVR
jgi:hypothetical protein